MARSVPADSFMNEGHASEALIVFQAPICIAKMPPLNYDNFIMNLR